MSWTIQRRGRVAVVTMTTKPVSAQSRAFPLRCMRPGMDVAGLRS